jgi:AcrR family transcriptional regulator
MPRRVKPKPATSRRDRARATRLRMIHAAHELFCERGYTGTRMADVAEAAGVAVQTVYFTFHTKAELLKACYDLGVLGEDDPRPPPLQPWYLEMLEAIEPGEAARRFAAGNGSIVQRVAVLDDVVRSAVHEPDAAAIRGRSEQLRREGYADVVAHFKKRFGLRTGLTARRATDLLLMLGGPAVYRTLVVEYGWSHAAYVDWLARTLSETLLPA